MTPDQLDIASRSMAAIREIDHTIAALQAAMAEMATQYTSQHLVIHHKNIKLQHEVNQRHEAKREASIRVVGELNGLPIELMKPDQDGGEPVFKPMFIMPAPADVRRTTELQLSSREMIQVIRSVIASYKARRANHIHLLTSLGIRIA